MTRRMSGIDALRGLAVILMLIQHLMVWLWNVAWNINVLLHYHPLMILFNALGGLAAPLFITLAGFSSELFSENNKNQDKRLLVRGVIIILYGYILNILVPCWFTIGSWYVLQIIGFSIALSPLLKKMSTVTLIITGFIILILTIAIQDIMNISAIYQTNLSMSDYHMEYGIFRLILAGGHFPIFPWLMLFIGGILAGKWVIEKRFKNVIYLASVMLMTGFILPVFNLLGFDFAVRGDTSRFFKLLPSFYPALTPITLILSSLALFAIVIIMSIENRKLFSKSNPLVCLGHISLTILLTHAVIFKQLSMNFNLYKVFSEYATIFGMFMIIGLYTLLSVWWSRYDYKFSAEWLLRKISG